MSLKGKILFLANDLLFYFKLSRLRRELKQNKTLGKYNFIFQCDIAAHFPYLKPYWEIFKSEPNVEICFAGWRNGGNVKKYLLYNGIDASRIIEYIEFVKHTKWDLYMSPTSWGNVFPKNRNCPRIQIFHSLADKNILYGESLRSFNAIFVNGPIHHKLLEKYLFGPFPESKNYCKTYNVGYAKIDDLFDDTYSAASLKKKLGISERDKHNIILYAPNWERTSALNKYGEDVLRVLASMEHIILIKLHFMSLLPSRNKYMTGGTDWLRLLDKYEHFGNIRIVREQNINPYLMLADLMITDYGGVALEYICTGKPIIYLDCPEFFEERGKEIMEYWSRDTGYIVSNVKDIPSAVNTALSDDPNKKRLRQNLAKNLLYNPGKAAQVGKQTILNTILKED